MLGGGSAAALGEPSGRSVGDGDAVELREFGRFLHRNRTIATLVGADDDGLPPSLGLLLDPVQGQPLLCPDRAQPDTECLCVVVRHVPFPTHRV